MTMLYSIDEVPQLRFQSVRLELDRLANVPGYSIPETYVAALLLQAAVSAQDERELANAVRKGRSWLGGRCDLDAFWSAVAAKPFAPATACAAFV